MAQFELIFHGAEVASWRELLIKEGVQHVGISFMAGKQKPRKAPYLIADRFPDNIKVMVDPGLMRINGPKNPRTNDELLIWAKAYEDFCAVNADRISFFAEFDALPLGQEWIESRREAFYSRYDNSMPVWHEKNGVADLSALCSSWGHVGVLVTELRTGRNLTPLLNNAVLHQGVHLHGSGLTRPEILQTTFFSSAASTSWLSPTRFADTIVWDGTKLHRYPKQYKDQARRRHRMLFTRKGFDAAKIEADDSTELTRFTIWSWLQLEASVSARRVHRVPRAVSDPFGQRVDPEVTDTTSAEELEINPDIPTEDTATTGVATRDEVSALSGKPEPLIRRAKTLLPVVSLVSVEEKSTDEDGVETTTKANLPGITVESNRACDSCYVSSQCPAFSPGAECAFTIPLEVKTVAQRDALVAGLIEMQSQRVAFGRYVEELQGGYPDPNISAELDRLFDLLAAQKELLEDSDTFEMNVKAKSRSGALARIFGAKQALPFVAPMDETQTNLALDDVLDGEVV